MSRLKTPGIILLFIHGVNIVAAEGEVSTMLNRLNPNTMAVRVTGNLPSFPASLFVFCGIHPSIPVGAEYLAIMSPRCDNEVSIINFNESPDFPTFPFPVHPNVAEDVTAQAAIMLGMGYEAEFMA